MHQIDQLHKCSISESARIELPTGTLDIQVCGTQMPLADICGFAARQNPRRGFLFVSKVLGKHIPVRPSKVREVHTLLARQIPLDLPGPVVVIGMAETAICLGHGVFDEYVRQSGRQDVMFTQSTRYRVSNNIAVEFREEHSHAEAHFIYEPEDALLKLMFRGARSLVVIDDEASTGRTFVNLATQMIAAMPFLERVVTGVITDWRGTERTLQTLAAMPVPASSIAILRGQYQFTPSSSLKFVEMPKVVGNDEEKDALLPQNFGRLGVGAVIGSQAKSGDFSFPFADEILDRLVSRLTSGNRAGKLLILGTGEFAYPPFLMAEALERAGVDVFFQSTTRSPIMIGHAIGCRVEHSDNYEDGIANYIYNARREDYDRIIVCHETPVGSVDTTLTNALGAETLHFGFGLDSTALKG